MVRLRNPETREPEDRRPDKGGRLGQQDMEKDGDKR